MIDFVKKNIWGLAIILLSLFYFFPHTYKWLFLDYDPFKGYGLIPIIFYYAYYIFFVCSCISLLQKANKVQRFLILLFVTLIVVVSEAFAFRDVLFLKWLFLACYLLIFFTFSMQIISNNLNFVFLKKLNIIGYFASIIWILLEWRLFG